MPNGLLFVTHPPDLTVECKREAYSEKAEFVPTDSIRKILSKRADDLARDQNRLGREKEYHPVAYHSSDRPNEQESHPAVSIRQPSQAGAEDKFHH